MNNSRGCLGLLIFGFLFFIGSGLIAREYTRSSLAISSGAFVVLQNPGIPGPGSSATLEYHLYERPLFTLDWLAHHPFGLPGDDWRLGLRLVVLSLRAEPSAYSRRVHPNSSLDTRRYRNFFYGLLFQRLLLDEERWQVLGGAAAGLSTFSDRNVRGYEGNTEFRLPETTFAFQFGLTFRWEFLENDGSRNFLSVGPRLHFNPGNTFPFQSVLLFHLGIAVEIKD